MSKEPNDTILSGLAIKGHTHARMIAAPIEHEARIIADLLASDRRLYESEARRSGIDTSKVTFEGMRQFAAEQFDPKLTTTAFVEYAIHMANTMLPYIAKRSWSVLCSDRPGEGFVVSDDPVVLEWPDGVRRRLGPGHAHIKTELTVPLSSNAALLGCYEPFTVESDAMPQYVSGVNSRTISASSRFIAASQDAFILQDEGKIITSEILVEQLRSR